MASLTAPINVVVDKETKEEATAILKDLGLSMSTAINLFLKQLIMNDGLPFEVKKRKPSKELIDALQEGEDILNGKIQKKGYHDVRKMFEDILDEN